MNTNVRLFPADLVKSLLKEGRFLDIIQLRTGRNNHYGNLEKKLNHIQIICDNLDNNEKVNWRNYAYLVGVTSSKQQAHMGWLAFYFRAFTDKIMVENRTNLSKFIGEFRKTNKNILTSRDLIVIPKNSELGILYKFYDCDFKKMLEGTGH